MSKTSKPIIMEWDDLCDATRGKLAFVAQLSEHYANFVGTLFTIPARCSRATVDEARAIKGVKLAVHGWRHSFAEAMSWTTEQTEWALARAQDLGIDEHVFRAPGWLIREEVYEGCRNKGYVVADHYEYRCKPPETLEGLEWKKRIYTYNRPLRNPATARVHGHLPNVSGNGIEESMTELLNFDRDAKFLSIPDALSQFAGKVPVCL